MVPAGPSPVWDKHCAQWRRLQKIGRKLYVVDLGVKAGLRTRRQPKFLDGRRLFPGYVCPKSCGGRLTIPVERPKRRPKLWVLYCLYGCKSEMDLSPNCNQQRMGNNWTTNVALSQQENRGPNRLMGFEKLNTETAKTRERATPERAMIPSNEFIYI